MRAGRFEFYQPTPLLRELGILAFLADDPSSSQKRIAESVGLGAAMVHSYLHTLQDQGLVEFRGSSSKKLQYVLTSEGKKVLESLASKHLAEIHRLIGEIKESVLRGVERAEADGARRLAVVADSSIREMIEGMNIQRDVCLVYPRIETLAPGNFIKSMSEPPDALLVALMAPGDEMWSMLADLERNGMRVYRAI